MAQSTLKVVRRPIRLVADPVRVIARLFIPGREARVHSIIDRVLRLSDREVLTVLERVLQNYSPRHRDLKEVFDKHFAAVAHHLNGRADLSQERRWVLGAYFTMEYSVESVALFNPSMVLHPNQEGMTNGAARFVMSLRAIGEGHISSIQFRSGVIDPAHGITFNPVLRFAATAQPVDDKTYEKRTFFLKLIEMGAYKAFADPIIQRLSEHFTIADLKSAIEEVRPTHHYVDTFDELAENMLWLTRSNYQLDFPPDSLISERVIFPVTENESRGIEDARFVRFTECDGSVTYYATCAAYNGFRSLPQFIETPDFRHFKIHTLNGVCVQDKGMALFPRKIGDHYVMVARQDGENMYLLRSENLFFWNQADPLHSPAEPWEFVQTGNCGSPLETSEGWLLLTHGVGPMREYQLAALLLDLEDPSRVIGRLREPILIPIADERDGYVPNVVYSCGAMIHNDNLIIPYGLSDTSTGVAFVSLPDLLAHFDRC